MRAPFTVTNVDRHGKTSDTKLFVKVGTKWRTFGEEEWKSGGLRWLVSEMKKAAKSLKRPGGR